MDSSPDRQAPGGSWVPRDQRPPIFGKPVDEQTRCVHYHSPLDVVAIKFACCVDYYPCHACHSEDAGHEARPWPPDARDEVAILCGVCGHQMTISDYLIAEQCSSCGARFNPGCSLHQHLYFAAD